MTKILLTQGVIYSKKYHYTIELFLNTNTMHHRLRDVDEEVAFITL